MDPKQTKGNLYLIPVTLGDSPVTSVLPEKVLEVIHHIDFYIVENVRTARRMLIKMGLKKPIDELTFFTLDKHTDPREIDTFLTPAAQHDIGLLSEAGVPGVADPGAEIVQLAHHKNIRVIPLTGPSSIILSVMSAGLNGQNFAFVGYLPVKKPDRIHRLKELEKRSKQEKQSQLFIETPYRNNQLLEDIIHTCQPDTRLCIAVDITLESEYIHTRTIKEWAKNKPELHKRPAIFILQA